MIHKTVFVADNMNNESPEPDIAKVSVADNMNNKSPEPDIANENKEEISRGVWGHAPRSPSPTLPHHPSTPTPSPDNFESHD